MEIQICRFQETILEIVEIEEHTVHIKLRLRIAVGPIQPTCTTQLDVRQLTDRLLQEFFLLLIVSTASLSSALDGIKERSSAQISLDIAEFIITHSQNLRHRQLTEIEMISQIHEGVILITARTDNTYHRIPILLDDTEILAVTSLPCQLDDISRLFASPLLVEIN